MNSTNWKITKSLQFNTSWIDSNYSPKGVSSAGYLEGNAVLGGRRLKTAHHQKLGCYRVLWRKYTVSTIVISLFSSRIFLRNRQEREAFFRSASVFKSKWKNRRLKMGTYPKWKCVRFADTSCTVQYLKLHGRVIATGGVLHLGIPHLEDRAR